MKALIKPVLLFAFICLCGLFIGAAGGISWGTRDAGALAMMTLVLAGLVAWVISIRGQNHD